MDNFFSNENLCRRKGVQVARIILLFFFAIIPQVEPQAKTPGGYFWEGFYTPNVGIVRMAFRVNEVNGAATFLWTRDNVGVAETPQIVSLAAPPWASDGPPAWPGTPRSCPGRSAPGFAPGVGIRGRWGTTARRGSPCRQHTTRGPRQDTTRMPCPGNRTPACIRRLDA